VNCLFDGNTAIYGGAVFAVNTPYTVSLSECVFQYNGATRGGAIYGYNIPLVVENCLIARNYASSDGGGMFLNRCYPSSLSRCTFYQNEAVSGGGISLLADTDLTVDHAIVVGCANGGATAVPETATMTFSCSDLFGNFGGDWTGSIAGQYGVNGNFSANPLFCDAPGVDLTLRTTSPCAPGNHPDGAGCGQIGARPVGCGGVPVEERSWGAIKSMFAD
jgi:predicted outer membrane repeat protein